MIYTEEYQFFYGVLCMPLFGKKIVLSKTELSTKLTELGHNSDQFTLINSPETDFIVERKIVDASGYGIAGIDELKKSYKAYLLLDEQAHEARYNEEMAETSKEANISSGGIGISGEKKFFRGKSLGSKQFGKSWGVKDNDNSSSIGKIYDYSFDVNKVRDPIKKLVQDSGWKFKQVISKEAATYKR
ncbi:MAG: hypothetical protein ACM3WQ_01850 [Chloroflexota bacterium]